MSGKLVGPLRQERATICIALKGREVLVEKHYDPEDQLELMAKSFIDKKLSLLALQLQMRGADEGETENLLRNLVSLEKFCLIDLSRFIDLMSQRVGNLNDPVFVIGAIAENVTRFQPDANHAVIMAGVLINDFAALNDPEKEKQFAAALKGN
jgi:hypothetical protein